MEQKKRVRPTWAMVRALEEKLASAVEELNVAKESMQRHVVKIAQLEELADRRETELFVLRNRGFWARVLNR